MLKKIIVLIVVLLFFLGGLVFLIGLGFTGGRTVAQGTIESWLMIPSILKDDSLENIGEVQEYYYAAGEASAPSVSKVYILSKGDRDSIERNVRYYFISHGFRTNSQGEFRKDREKFDFIIEKKGELEWIVDIALFDYS